MSWEVLRRCSVSDIGGPKSVDGDVASGIIARITQIGGVDQRRTRPIQLQGKCVVAAIMAGIEGARRSWKAWRIGLADDIGCAALIHRDTVAEHMLNKCRIGQRCAGWVELHDKTGLRARKLVSKAPGVTGKSAEVGQPGDIGRAALVDGDVVAAIQHAAAKERGIL